MDNQRLLPWALFGMMAWLSYQAWVQDYGSKPAEIPATTEEPALDVLDDALPQLTETGTEISAPDVLPSFDDTPEVAEAALAPAIFVKTSVFDIELSTQGGTVRRAVLLNYPVAKDRPDDLVELLSTETSRLGIIQSGLRSAGEGDEPNHRVTFTSQKQSYSIIGSGELIVPLIWSDGAGVTVEKRYRFTADGYTIVLEQEITNNSAETWRGAEYVQLLRSSAEHERTMFDVDSYSAVGPIIYDGEKSEKLKRSDLLENGPYIFASEHGWFGAIQHHFVSAVVPTPGTSQRYSVSVRDAVSTASSIGPTQAVEPGTSKVFTTTLFVGPKLQSQLEDIDESLKLTVDYGWLTILSQPLFWVLSKMFGLFGNWGVAIISVTVLIKAVFYKLTEASGRSMAKMRNLQPRLKALQERYKDDKPQLSQAMMEMYKREKVNPAAGCLPILIQMPFFLAFYWVLLESVEMRQAPFALWLTDLSSKDPFFILPLIMGGAMFFQQRLNPQVGDPVQVKVMQVMPIIFTGFFAFFPSGLVLYWVTNTLLSIAQQWNINKVVEREARQAKGGKRSKKSD
ncbi:MAG: membrane protein insertase YidC [Desulfobulbaceae bacterium]|nr:membrane protein insertase YidC [Desulfobulbaceae bacterium]